MRRIKACCFRKPGVPQSADQETTFRQQKTNPFIMKWVTKNE
jgi:hypothetical protein